MTDLQFLAGSNTKADTLCVRQKVKPPNFTTKHNSASNR